MAGIENYLQELDEQNVQEESKIQVVRNPVIDNLFDKYEQWLSEQKGYDHAVELIKKTKYTSKDIREFSMLIKKYECNELFSSSGFFLSALINQCRNKYFEIITGHLTKEIDWIGFFNIKHVVVIGSVGEASCAYMKKGEVNIEGNANDFLGEGAHGGICHVKGDAGYSTGLILDGGTIIVNGNTGDGAGFGMQSGKMTINGNAGLMTGTGSAGGEIYVGGRIQGIARKDSRCKIFRRGEQLR